MEKLKTPYRPDPIFKKTNNIVGWVIFAIAAFTYLSTMEATASLWDCAEFIASTYKLQIGHPPGAPFFNILGRVFTLFADGGWAAEPSQNAAICVNILSALASAFTILFLFWTITHFAKKLLPNSGQKMPLSSIIASMGAGAVGALAYTFSDTFWFSAVEAEVYASSACFTAVVFWLVLKWDDYADEPNGNKWLILIMYLIGLSVGVHLLNLLVIPPICLVFYFRKYDFSFKGLIITLIVGIILLATVMYGVIFGSVDMAAQFDLFFTKNMGLALHSGTLTFLVLLTASFSYGIYLTAYSENKHAVIIITTFNILLIGIPAATGSIAMAIIVIAIVIALLYILPYRPQILNIVLTSLFVILIGYSSFAMVVIRSNANPPMDQNSPDDMFTLQSYLGRDQYGASPLFKGRYFSSKLVDISDEGPSYKSINGKYVETSRKTKYTYSPVTLLPRMYSQDENHINQYKNWAGMDKNHPGVKKPVMIPSSRGGGIADYTWVPTTTQKMRFIMQYQFNWMYWRYFMWNFAGRQNDTQAYGDNPTTGNWISGIPLFDEQRVGKTEYLPTRMKNEPTRNVYYMLPLLLGLIGLLYQLFHKSKGLEGFIIVMVLFLMTGVAIIIYLNQTPMQPRERDYAYAGSFYAFAIWIGLGVLSVINLMKNEEEKRIIATVMTVISLILVPGIMAQQNYPDHNRSKRSIANDLGYNYLMSCAPNAILFTYGDNDTFPLWYLQDVEGVRRDIRVCNLSYLQIDWYIEQMSKKAYDSEPLPISLKASQYRGDKLNVLNLDTSSRALDLSIAMRAVSKGLKNKRGEDFLPSNNFFITVDKNKVLKSGNVPKGKENTIPEVMNFSINKSRIFKQQLIIMEILANNNWNRPIYFDGSAVSNFPSLSKYLYNEGLAYRLVPTDNGGFNRSGNINLDVMYDNMMNKFRYGNLDKEGYVMMDYQAARMFWEIRRSMIQLGQALAENGEIEKAKNIANKCLEVFPERNLPMGYSPTAVAEVSALAMGELLAKVGEKEKAIAVLQKMSDESHEILVWYIQQDPKIFVKDDYSRARTIYQLSEQQISQISNDSERWKKTMDDLQALEQSNFSRAN